MPRFAVHGWAIIVDVGALRLALENSSRTGSGSSSEAPPVSRSFTRSPRATDESPFSGPPWAPWFIDPVSHSSIGVMASNHFRWTASSGIDTNDRACFEGEVCACMEVCSLAVQLDPALSLPIRGLFLGWTPQIS